MGCDSPRGLGRSQTHASPPRAEERVSCCYAVQDQVWVQDPDGAQWEVYTVLADAPTAASSCC